MEQIFEYKTAFVKGSLRKPFDRAVEEKCNELAKEGWVLVSTSSWADDGWPRVVLIFKREKEEQ